MLSTNKSIVFRYSLMLLLLFQVMNLRAQNKAPNSIYDWFDSKVGKENLAINNGVILTNYDRVLNNNDRFYFSNYLNGSVVYDNQIYNNILLNYDILNDDLIIKPSGEFDKNAIILIKEKVSSFSVDGINYINLDASPTKNLDFINGFYEEHLIANKFTFYSKHKKDKSERINGDKIYDDFTEKTYYALFYNTTFYEISSKKSVIVIFPDYKKFISQFYSDNDYLEKANKTQFLNNLFLFLNNKIK